MYRSSMHHPFYAQRAWNRFRSARPLDRVHPADRRRLEAIAAGNRTRKELAAHFADTCGNGKPTQTQEKGPSTMIKLNCGISRKVGEPNYGSRGASVNVELELESSAAQDADALHEKIRRLFAVAKASVDEEMGLPGRQAGPGTPAPRKPPANGQAFGRAAPGAIPNPRQAPATTAKQVGIGLAVGRYGVPPGHEVLDGNRDDVTALQGIVVTMEVCYGEARRTWALDRGMAGQANLQFLEQGGRGPGDARGGRSCAAGARRSTGLTSCPSRSRAWSPPRQNACRWSAATRSSPKSAARRTAGWH
jgi:hypothetical protein